MEFSSIDTALIIDYAMSVLGALLVLFIGFAIAGWAKSATRSALERSNLDPTLQKFFSNLVRYLVLIIVGIAVLSLFGINVTSIAAILAAAGFAVGLALQGTLSNFAAGMMLLIFRPFGVGDVVEVAGERGKVSEISLFNTHMDTPDNRRLIIPNGSIFGSPIENFTFHDTRRVDVAVGTDYPADLNETRRILEEAAAAVDKQAPGKDPQVYLDSLGDSSINWSVRVWAATPDYWGVKEDLTQKVKDALDAAGIGIPYPQMDVHMDAQPLTVNSAAVDGNGRTEETA